LPHLLNPQAKLSGFGGKFRSTESLWCIGSKICWANLIANVGLYRGAKTGDDGSKPNFLVTGLKFNFEKFARLTEIPIETVKAGTGLRLIGDDSPLLHDMAFRDLRYCPDCMSTGFHSILFQFPLFSQCPEHNVPLLECCPSCKGLMPHRWPTSQVRVFRCCHCGHALWRPRQERYAANKADACFDKMADWASGWIRRVIRFSGSNAPMKRWVTAGDDEKWTARGLPELAGIFTPRALRRREDAHYWGGRHVYSREGTAPAPTMAECYLTERHRLAHLLDFTDDALSTMLAAFQQDDRLNLTPDRWAFIAWRVFWESATVLSSLTGDDLGKGGNTAAALFEQYFKQVTVPGGYSERDQALINGLAQREVLRASFVHSLNQVTAEGSRLSRVIQSLPETPLPLIFAKPVPSGVVVEWIHQRDVSVLGQQLLG
jgi:hypothetical protein